MGTSSKRLLLPQCLQDRSKYGHVGSSSVSPFCLCANLTFSNPPDANSKDFFFYYFFSPEVPEHLRLKILLSPQPPLLVPVVLCLQASRDSWEQLGSGCGGGVPLKGPRWVLPLHCPGQGPTCWPGSGSSVGNMSVPINPGRTSGCLLQSSSMG